MLGTNFFFDFDSRAPFFSITGDAVWVMGSTGIDGRRNSDVKVRVLGLEAKAKSDFKRIFRLYLQ